MKSISSLICLVALAAPGLTQTVNLGAAATFGALAPKSITNSGATKVTGNIGVESLLLTGFPPGTFTGTMETDSTAVTSAVAAANAARTAALAFTADATLATLGVGATLTPGVYAFDKTAVFVGNLTLDGAGTYIFHVASTLTVETGSEVILEGGALAADVWWAVGSSATFEGSSIFQGNVLAASTIGLGAGTTINGGVYSGASITLDDNEVGLVAAT